MSLFAALTPLPMDPILLAFQDFASDKRAERVNLSVGMYYDETGAIPVMRAVAMAEENLARRKPSWGYLMSEGVAALRKGAAQLVFGDALLESIGHRLVTMQTLGGTGAIRLAADVIHKLQPDAVVAISKPGWPNHHAIFTAAGLSVTSYAYYDLQTRGVCFDAMRESIAALPPGAVVVLHACCHNPTGADLSTEQWNELADLLFERRLTAFLDMAYAGFGDGLMEDIAPVRLLAGKGVPLFVATSFSKSFALYGERVGVLFVLVENPQQASDILDMMKSLTRTLYSTPPSHGALLVSEILGDAALRAAWQDELEAMRTRIMAIRAELLRKVSGKASVHDFRFLTKQKGLFTYSGLSSQQMDAMKRNYAVHAISDGRLCMAAINGGNMERVAEAMRSVTR
jgi:aromatic-amino-acid transaminase